MNPASPSVYMLKATRAVLLTIAVILAAGLLVPLAVQTIICRVGDFGLCSGWYFNDILGWLSDYRGAWIACAVSYAAAAFLVFRREAIQSWSGMSPGIRLRLLAATAVTLVLAVVSLTRSAA
jgi:hypothetical protein